MGGRVAAVLWLVMAVQWAAAQQGGSEQSWIKRTITGKEIISNLEFYFHDTLSGNNPTAEWVASPSNTNKSPTKFGSLFMADDPLTVGPQPDSKLIGRARGLYGSAGQKDLGLIMAMNFWFVDDIFNGSSFNILGINPSMEPLREMPIVGGTGLFRLTRGYALANTYSFDATSGDAIVGYNITVATFF